MNTNKTQKQTPESKLIKTNKRYQGEYTQAVDDCTRMGANKKKTKIDARKETN